MPFIKAEMAEGFAGLKTLVVGLGSTGIAVSRFLKRLGAEVSAVDAKPMEDIPGAAALAAEGVKVRSGPEWREGFLSASIVVVSPGVPSRSPLLQAARSRGAEVISDVELAYRFMDVPVIAVAGTNGKTTTTTLLGNIFEKAGKRAFVGGNIGTPAIEFFDREERAEAAVLEISSFHLESTKSFNPHIGVLLNITEDHLDRYDGFDDYARTKMRLFENQRAEDYAVINAADPVIAAMFEENPAAATVVPFTVRGALTEGLFLKGSEIVFINRALGIEETYPTDILRIRGVQNIENAMAAAAAARLYGISRDVVMETFAEFGGLRHRMEFVREFEGVRYINDSKGTNIGALKMALSGIDSPVILIAGGRDKGGDYGALSGLVRGKVKLLITMGEAGPRIRDAFSGSVKTASASSLEEAVLKARREAGPGDTVLLSPACSSFDMFRGFKERGERFRTLVKGLA
ncbi:MAG: UDP-N-acetylmuramoyl-L-alanine--D-glutamate ligase [Thermodesulfobacteriota bacterium]